MLSEPFPEPSFRRSVIRNLNVIMQDSSILKKKAIDNGAGSFYEIGADLKRAIFGRVIHAQGLRSIGNDEYIRTGVEFAIKVSETCILCSVFLFHDGIC